MIKLFLQTYRLYQHKPVHLLHSIPFDAMFPVLILQSFFWYLLLSHPFHAHLLALWTRSVPCLQLGQFQISTVLNCSVNLKLRLPCLIINSPRTLLCSNSQNYDLQQAHKASRHRCKLLHNLIGYIFMIKFIPQLFCKANRIYILRIPTWI